MPLPRMLFIGCGGSGMDTVRLVRRRLEQRLDLLGLSPEQFPVAWQFVNIDVPAVESATDMSLIATKGIEYIGLTSPGDKYLHAGGIDESLVGAKDKGEDFAQWRPNQAFAPDITKGAGNIRAFGRAIGAWSLDERARGRISVLSKTQWE